MENKMSNEDNGTSDRLTLDDPVSPEQLQQLTRIQETRGQVADRLLQLEEEKIQCLAMAKRLNEENNKVFALILGERGLPQTTAVDLDRRTGKLTLQVPASGQAKPAAEPTPQTPQEPAGGEEAPAEE